MPLVVVVVAAEAVLVKLACMVIERYLHAAREQQARSRSSHLHTSRVASSCLTRGRHLQADAVPSALQKQVGRPHACLPCAWAHDDAFLREVPDVPYGICCKVYKATQCCIGQTGWVSVGTITVSLRKHLGAKASQIAAGSFVQRSESLWDHQGRHWRLGGATRVGARMRAFFRLGAFVCFCGMRGCASLSCSARRVPTGAGSPFTAPLAAATRHSFQPRV